MSTLIQKRAAIINASAALAARESYAAAVMAGVNRETALGKGVDAELFYGPLGLGAAGSTLWQDQGERIGWAMRCHIVGAMRAGATKEEATLSAWSAITKPDFIVILHPVFTHPDGGQQTITPTACQFPVGSPLTAWALVAESREAALAMIAAEVTTPGTILAALLAAQPAP